MVEIWEARRLANVLQTGRTRPVIMDCELVLEPPILSSEHLGEHVFDNRLMVVKGLGSPELTLTGMANEMFGNLLAREFGIFTGEPAVVNISQTLAHSIRPSLNPHCLNAGLAAGSELHRAGLVAINPYITYLPEEIAEIARLYAFDLLVQNADRQKDNANCAMSGKRVFAYDFETCFSFLQLFGTLPNPWELSTFGIHEKHVLREVLRRQNINWTPFVDNLSLLTETRILEIASKLPTEWQANIPAISAHLLVMAEHASELAIELQRSIS